jgi:hypothetical protein
VHATLFLEHFVSLSLHQASIPVFVRNFDNLTKIIDKAAANAAARNIDPSVFITARLAPDMLPFSKQIQIASDISKGAASRLASVDIPNFADTESTFDELKERISRTVTYLRSLDAAAIDASSERDITFKASRDLEIKLPGNSYLLTFAMPNFYFHISAAYMILRHNGVNLGKLDFLGTPPGVSR